MDLLNVENAVVRLQRVALETTIIFFFLPFLFEQQQCPKKKWVSFEVPVDVMWSNSLLDVIDRGHCALWTGGIEFISRRLHTPRNISQLLSLERFGNVFTEGKSLVMLFSY